MNDLLESLPELIYALAGHEILMVFLDLWEWDFENTSMVIITECAENLRPLVGVGVFYEVSPFALFRDQSDKMLALYSGRIEHLRAKLNLNP
jgi:hypothetical protein